MAKSVIELAREGLLDCEVVKSVMMPVNQQNYATLCRKLIEIYQIAESGGVITDEEIKEILNGN